MNNHISSDTLLAFSEKTLSPDRHAEVADHLATCALCRQEQEVWESLRQRTTAHYQGVAAVALPPSDAWSRLQNQLVASSGSIWGMATSRLGPLPIMLLLLVFVGVTGYGVTLLVAGNSLANSGIFLFGADPTPTATLLPTAIPESTATATASFTPTVAPSATPSSTATLEPTATRTPTETVVPPTSTATATPFVTATPMPLPTLVPTLPPPPSPTIASIPTTDPAPPPPPPPDDDDDQGDDDDDQGDDGEGDGDDNDDQGDEGGGDDDDD